jgi:hypothetical protein
MGPYWALTPTSASMPYSDAIREFTTGGVWAKRQYTRHRTECARCSTRQFSGLVSEK